MTIEELCKRSYDTAVAKGWHEESRSLGEVITLMHSEVSEALECWRDSSHKLEDVWVSEGGKPEGFVIELADLLIRIADTATDMKLPLEKILFNTLIPMLGRGYEHMVIKEKHLETIPEMLGLIHIHLARAYDASFVSGAALEGMVRGWVALPPTSPVLQPEIKLRITCNLADAIVFAGAICQRYKLDLEKAVLLKMDYNDTRPHRHGGKRG
jgi:hypothetical protein